MYTNCHGVVLNNTQIISHKGYKSGSEAPSEDSVSTSRSRSGRNPLGSMDEIEGSPSTRSVRMTRARRTSLLTEENLATVASSPRRTTRAQSVTSDEASSTRARTTRGTPRKDPGTPSTDGTKFVSKRVSVRLSRNFDQPAPIMENLEKEVDEPASKAPRTPARARKPLASNQETEEMKAVTEAVSLELAVPEEKPEQKQPEQTTPKRTGSEISEAISVNSSSPESIKAQPPTPKTPDMSFDEPMDVDVTIASNASAFFHADQVNQPEQPATPSRGSLRQSENQEPSETISSPNNLLKELFPNDETPSYLSKGDFDRIYSSLESPKYPKIGELKGSGKKSSPARSSPAKGVANTAEQHAQVEQVKAIAASGPKVSPKTRPELDDSVVTKWTGIMDELVHTHPPPKSPGQIDASAPAEVVASPKNKSKSPKTPRTPKTAFVETDQASIVSSPKSQPLVGSAKKVSSPRVQASPKGFQVSDHEESAPQSPLRVQALKAASNSAKISPARATMEVAEQSGDVSSPKNKDLNQLKESAKKLNSPNASPARNSPMASPARPAFEVTEQVEAPASPKPINGSAKKARTPRVEASPKGFQLTGLDGASAAKIASPRLSALVDNTQGKPKSPKPIGNTIVATANSQSPKPQAITELKETDRKSASPKAQQATVEAEGSADVTMMEVSGDQDTLTAKQALDTSNAATPNQSVGSLKSLRKLTNVISGIEELPPTPTLQPAVVAALKVASPIAANGSIKKGKKSVTLENVATPKANRNSEGEKHVDTPFPTIKFGTSFNESGTNSKNSSMMEGKFRFFS